MSEYIDVVLTKKGVFCAAPPWVVKAGDLVCLPNLLTGDNEVLEVISVSTDIVDGEHIKQIEQYIGYPLPKITAKYFLSKIEWEESNVHE